MGYARNARWPKKSIVQKNRSERDLGGVFLYLDYECFGTEIHFRLIFYDIPGESGGVAAKAFDHGVFCLLALICNKCIDSFCSIADVG